MEDVLAVRRATLGWTNWFDESNFFVHCCACGKVSVG